jgi:hypothetical protein
VSSATVFKSWATRSMASTFTLPTVLCTSLRRLLRIPDSWLPKSSSPVAEKGQIVRLAQPCPSPTSARAKIFPLADPSAAPGTFS